MNKYYQIFNENENIKYFKNKYINVQEFFIKFFNKCYCTKKCCNKYLDKLTNNEEVLEPLITPEFECEICEIKFLSKEAFNEHLDRCHMNNDSTLITDL